MGDKTAISWADATWNPLRGCTAVSAGCDHCYAASVALRFGGPGQPYEGLAEQGPDGVPRFTGSIRLVPEHLTDPLRWQRPRRVFVNSMSDLFHAGVPQEYIDDVFAVMALATRHTFQILTKRPQRMANYLNSLYVQTRLRDAVMRLALGRPRPLSLPEWRWPLPNVWCGTSVEDARVLHRADALRRVPAAVRFLSCEPLIGPLTGLNLAGIHWVIVGGESGAHFRPMDSQWARDIRDACQAAGVPFFFKQSSGLKAGRGTLLDGREWHEYPA